VLEQVFRYLLPIDDTGGDGVSHGRVVRAPGVPDEEVPRRALVEFVNEVAEFEAVGLAARPSLEGVGPGASTRAATPLRAPWLRTLAGVA
jgi:hypothetical protein